MVTTMISHEVKNFEEWKKGFDADSSNRESMGVKITGVYQSVENPNKVAVFSEVPNMKAFNGFLSNPDLAASMEKAGVIGKPDFKILSDTQ